MQTLPKQSVLAIYIPKQGLVRQGKFAIIDGKPCFIANMTARKWWNNYSGYAISRRVLESLPRGTKIIFKRPDLNQYYITNKSKFQKKGILVNYGKHSQWCLPLKNWQVKSGSFEEPRNLPVINLEVWQSTAKAIKSQEENLTNVTYDEWLFARQRMAEVFRRSYA